MSQVAAPDNSVSHAGTLTLRRATLRFVRIIPLLLLGLTAIWSAPRLLSAYNIDCAGRAMEAGLKWPEPRRADSLPTVVDHGAAKQALAHLAAAIRWNPRNAYAHRLAGQVYTAQGQLAMAAQALEQAQSLAAKDPLVAWERALVYEQMAHVVASAPRENILPDLASVPIDAPAQPIDTVYCRAEQPQSCYVGLDRYTQPYAAVPDGLPVTADVLFMHPPAGVRLTYFVSPERPALQFLLGLDPGVHTWDTDGATFQVWITAEGQSSTLVFEQTLDQAAAREGWHPGWADLSAWAGKTAAIELRTTGGPNGSTAYDWYAWGNVELTTIEAASLGLLAPAAQAQATLSAPELVGSENTYTVEADAAFERGEFEIANRWYNRSALRSGQPQASLRPAIAALLANDRVRTAPHDRSLPIHRLLRSSVQIEAEELQWITNGAPMSQYPSSDRSAGVLWGVGTVVALVEVERAGNYTITVRAQNTQPPPVVLQVTDNSTVVGTFGLDRGDMSWQDLEVNKFMAAGIHVIGVTFQNDAVINGSDRNGVLDWLRIQAKP